jgi:uncharacterized membrane protein YbhN (UPF0104 family)
VGIGVTLLLLWWVLHDVRFDELSAQLRHARWGWLLAAVAVATLTFPLRAVRWRILLRREGRPIPWTAVWHATAIGFTAINLLGRWGEVARPYAARQLTGVRFSTAAASVGIERVFDALVIVLLLLAGAAAGGFTGSDGLGGVPLSRATAAALAVTAAGAVLVVAWPARWLRLAEAMATRLLPGRWAAAVVSFFEGMIAGLVSLRSARVATAVLFWSVALWLVNAASFALAFRAFGLSLPIGAAPVLQGAVTFGVAIPSTPGFLGVFEAAFRVALSLYGVTETQAASVAIGYHATTFVPITLLGLWSLGRANLRLRGLRADRTGEREDVSP